MSNLAIFIESQVADGAFSLSASPLEPYGSPSLLVGSVDDSVAGRARRHLLRTPTPEMDMQRLATLAAAAIACALAAPAFAGSPNVRISQVYGGGGNSGAPYGFDYVELFNNSGSPVNVGGWSLQYGSATGTVDLGACTNCLTVLPAGTTIQPCQYYLVQLAGGTSVSTPLPGPGDLVIPSASATNMSATSGKLGLVANSSTTPCAGAFVDLVGWGTANCKEGTAAGTLSNTSGAVRGGAGTTDTDNNSSDFAVVTTPVPHNAASAGNTACFATPALSRTWGRLKAMYH